ncbi:biotin-dependent carboxyltransferase family protein [Aurantibacter crassamenti]|uniref:5-oxoprolinase subunit C family protein n=1 Tax=Aurantibacter crassamenti TaxID=1837375 RepID=UPI001939C9C2|nr:biotin-dependent carboxyltransferase family protein [Aurantibacter crassamenti]MBM1107278.1 biotin-dependent carboxyltransferase family protein [Aurantibacter crassamenti]
MLKLLKSGFFTTVQDKGRFGFRDIGVPVAGVMDNLALEKANGLLENNVDAAVLEITMTGPTIVFNEPTYIVLSGAKMSATLNSEPILNYKVYKIKSGDKLSYGKLEKGIRCYLAVKDGFKTKKVLNSRSFSNAITKVNYLKDSSEVIYEPCTVFKPKISELKVNSYFDEVRLEVAKGPEYDMLQDKQLENIFGKDFTVSKENNRMAYQLNEKIQGHDTSMLTSATLPGTIQFTPAGKLIILMKDGQTTGGYPRILQLNDKAISILAQKRAGDKISFKLL